MLKQDHCRHTPYRLHSKSNAFTADKVLGDSSGWNIKHCVACGRPLLPPAIIFSNKYYAHHHWISATITAIISIILRQTDIEICRINAGIALISLILGFFLSVLILLLFDQFIRCQYPWETTSSETDEVFRILEGHSLQKAKAKKGKIFAILRGTTIMANSINLANYIVWLLLLLILINIACSIIFRRYHLLWFAAFFSPLTIICYFMNANPMINILIGLLLAIWITFMEIRSNKE